MGPSLGSYLLKQSDSEFRNIWCSIRNASLFTEHLCTWLSMLAVEDAMYNRFGSTHSV